MTNLLQTDLMTARKDPYGNELVFKEELDGTRTVLLKLAVDNRYRNIGVLVDEEGVVEYRKVEDEHNRYFKMKAWTIHEDLVKQSDFVVYTTPFGTYTISSSEALKKGKYIRHTASSFENKIAVPIRDWVISASERKDDFLVRTFGYEWYDELKDELSKRYMVELSHRVAARRKVARVFPSSEDVFRAYRLTPFLDVKVVIIGQDPYHDGSANGLAFSIDDKSHKVPPSLANINKELETDIFNGVSLFKRVDLSNWAIQGVFLLNTTLTVESGAPGAHSNYGWQHFTTATIRRLLQRGKKPLVFMLWGKHAQDTFVPLIEKEGNGSNLILTAAHPSPFSADKGFFGCKHFSKCNNFLDITNQREIAW